MIDDRSTTEIQKRIFIWKRVKALASRYGSPEARVWNTSLPGYTTALRWVQRAVEWAERRRMKDFAERLRSWWELDCYPNDTW